MKCALTKILPFILTLLVGLSLGKFSTLPGFLQVGAGQKAAPYSRTWLVIHYQPLPSFPQVRAETGGEPCPAARLRVRFDANGTISAMKPEEAMLEVDCTTAALLAAQRIVFTPASENGKPVSVWATVTYDFGTTHFTGVDKKGRRFCVASRSPIASPAKIVSVEGAKETEGWRVIYE